MIKINSVTSRSASFEIINDNPYYSGEEYDIYLNKEYVRKEIKNSFTINNLENEKEYLIQLKKNNLDIMEMVFKTEKELVTFDVRKFGAIGNGQKNDTLAIQTAIMACPKYGRVYIPAGIYKVSTLFLKDDITIEISKNAVLKGVNIINEHAVLPGIIDSNDDTEEYNYGTWEGNPLSCYTALITGINVKNVKIIGEGIIDGNADFEIWWKDAKKKKELAWRPRLVFLNNCENVLIENVTLKNSPSWTLHPYFSNNLKFLNLKVMNPNNSPNTDGIDPESCENVEIIGIDFSVGDDCIAIKSGKIYMGRKYKKSSQNLIIRNCEMKYGHGAVVVGSEMAGGVKNVFIEKCIFYQTDRGIRMKTRRGRGKDAIIDNIVANNIKMIEVETPFTINPFYYCDPDGKTPYVWERTKLPVDEGTPAIKNIKYTNINGTGMKIAAGHIFGLPESPIEELILENIEIEAVKENVEKAEPEMFSFAEKVSKEGFILGNIKKLKIKNVRVKGILNKEIQLTNIETVEE